MGARYKQPTFLFSTTWEIFAISDRVLPPHHDGMLEHGSLTKSLGIPYTVVT
jgi:hypothetical protein